MASLQDDMQVLRTVLKNGYVPRAYKALLAFMLDLRSHLGEQYPDAQTSGLYQGYMDMSYFALSPPDFKERDLKIAIVFNFEAFRFEAWMVGRNRKINKQYWEQMKDLQLPKYRIMKPAKGIDAIIEADLISDPDFSDLDDLTSRIETATSSFIADMRNVLPD